MIIYCQNETDYQNLKSYVKNVSKFFKEYEWLINSYLLEFYIEDSWHKLPLKWQSYLNYLSPNNLAQFLNNEKISVNQVIPLSLLCFQKCGNIYSFKRKETNLNDYNNLLKKLNLTDQSFIYTDLEKISSKNIFTRHLKLKKRHEVSRFSSLISNILDFRKTKLIDFGAGQGHLDRFLAIHFGFKIITLELEKNNSERAEKHDKQAINYLNKSSRLIPYKTENNLVLNKPSLPFHLNFKVDNENFKDLDINDSENAIIGLHSCGKLSVDMIELFCFNSAKYLFLCSCCYHKCDSKNFLLSMELKKYDFNLTFETKEIACHAIENYIDQLKNNYNKLKIHCYRALLEEIFFRHFKDLRKSELAKARRFETLSFIEYVKTVTRKLSLKIDDSLLDTDLIKNRLNNFLCVIKFYILRLHLAPMIENLFQVDRMLYLFEKNIPSMLIPVFDPNISPRNFILFAYKQ